MALGGRAEFAVVAALSLATMCALLLGSASAARAPKPVEPTPEILALAPGRLSRFLSDAQSKGEPLDLGEAAQQMLTGRPEGAARGEGQRAQASTGCLPHAGEGRACILPEFIPTAEWQEILEGQVIPGGLHIRMNLSTGKKEAKLLSP
mmetsp:Transcript_15321/g.42846  ORF Transcript_15321/g.42846 Transcript_15321/m.42846 type:complete len:149 (+) Transcript_15321:460-906(+)|eukprot:CAMPEP_0117666634 /NCGR_PEP_ID=MMETSP0804-20121206/10491_1 /TAXON_ID=1074897 /ORGANISM="Tetraselmis astigmatica, Strain CCMP880" /LENGTH=148 /DNA_ID=CAMNT_0005474213 /DNA_START=436 /DNA_END=882 /DNA_ORIENTATION=-